MEEGSEAAARGVGEDEEASLAQSNERDLDSTIEQTTRQAMAPRAFKVVLLGEVGVGKTSLFVRIKNDVFRSNLSGTQGIDCCITSLQSKGETLKLAVYDTAGLERFRTLTRNYYRNAHAVLLVYSVDNPSSLFYLARWAQDATQHAPTARKFLIGNKSDLENTVLDTTVQDFAMAQGCELATLVSAKSGAGVSAMLERISEVLLGANNRLAQFPLSLTWVDESIAHTYNSKQKTSCC